MSWNPYGAYRPLVTFLPILLLVGLTGCATGSAAPSDDYCLIAKPITYSPQDTPGTVAQIEQHNSDYVCRCEDDCQ